MADPFARFNKVILNRLGVPCSALVSGSIVTFNGVFKNSNLLRVDNSNQSVIDNVPVVDIETTIAKTLLNDSLMTVDGTVYQVRRKEAKDEGTYTTVELAVYVP